MCVALFCRSQPVSNRQRHRLTHTLLKENLVTFSYDLNVCASLTHFHDTFIVVSNRHLFTLKHFFYPIKGYTADKHSKDLACVKLN